MFLNYLKTTLRNLLKNKVYSLFTVFGLAIGLTIFIIAVLYVDFILKFDTFHKNAERIYGIVQVVPSGNKGEQHSLITPGPLLSSILNEFPEIESGTRFFYSGREIVQYQDKIFYEDGVIYSDQNFLSVFTYKMTQGNPETALAEPNSIVLTESIALKYFGDENPIGKSLTINNTKELLVTGIMEDVPKNSSVQFDLLISLGTAEANWLNDWASNYMTTCIMLPKKYDEAQVENKFAGFITKHFPDSPDSPFRMYLFPLLDFHLKSQHIRSNLYWDTTTQIYMAFATGLLFLLVVCLNYMSLSTARYMNRAKEVGMRKVVGAHRVQVAKQFLGESLIIAFIALPVAIIIYQLVIPHYSALWGNRENLSLWKSPYPMIYLIGIALFTGIISGSYPAFFLSAFKPVQVLKGNLQSGKKGTRIRKIFVVSQFAISVFLIIFAVIIRSQFNFLVNLDLGYSRDHIITIPIPQEIRGKIETFKKELLKHPDITSAAGSIGLPFKWESEQNVIPEGIDEKNAWAMNVYGIDYDAIKTLEMEIVLGRGFSRNYDDANSFILNETALKQLEWENPIGRQFEIEGQKGVVIGIAKDYHFRNLIYNISPAVLYCAPERGNYLFIKLTSQTNTAQVTDYVKEQWHRIAPNLPFESFMLNHRFEEYYSDNEKVALMSEYLGAITVVIACLGLLGLASYNVERKTKEIGIRKVLGASISSIINMLVSEFMLLVLISNIISWPAAYFLLNKLLQIAFVYRIDIPVNVFIFAGLITLSTAFLSVLSQTLRAAQANPVNTLKHE